MTQVLSADGLVFSDPTVSRTLRASAVGSAVAYVPEEAVDGFGALKSIVFLLDVTAIVLTGGVGPTMKLIAIIQRTPDGGVSWDDLLEFNTGNLTNGLTAQQTGEYIEKAVTPSAPASIQDASTTTSFAQRSNWLSEKLRVKWKLEVAGNPTGANVTFAVTAKGRP